ncbi:hypothetical protein [Streptomyces goshikiensis]|uniref:hypothetical protein n=1 Tax=Streptomyces goshikiensis TaxID=1942 RepID=UPI00366957A8
MSVLERTKAESAPGAPGAGSDAAEENHGREQALGALLFAARRMRLEITDRQVALLLEVAERHLLPPEDDFPHGTLRGYRRHRRRDEPACSRCREACRLEAVARRKRAGRRPLAPCGTEAAYHRHLRRWEEPCPACRTAHRQYASERRNRTAAAAS